MQSKTLREQIGDILADPSLTTIEQYSTEIEKIINTSFVVKRLKLTKTHKDVIRELRKGEIIAVCGVTTGMIQYSNCGFINQKTIDKMESLGVLGQSDVSTTDGWPLYSLTELGKTIEL